MGSQAGLRNPSSSLSRRERPLARLDTANFDPTGPSFDPLAPVTSPWSRLDDPGAVEAQAADLAALTDRAGLQIAALRGALDEAIRIDRAVGNKAGDLARRLEQGLRFARASAEG